jgi:hypothetical protein
VQVALFSAKNRYKVMKTFLITTFVAALAVFSSGCNKDNVKVYHVDKDDASAPPAPANPVATAPAPDANRAVTSAASTAPQVKYTLPDGWTLGAPNDMRVASFTVANPAGSPADVGIVPMPTMAQELPLVNMWREQMQLPPATEAEADKLGTPVAVGDGTGKLFDIPSDATIINGKARARTLVAMSTRGSTSWFFKMVGEESFVEAQKPVFLQFLKSISYGDAAAPAGMDMSQLPPSHPDIQGMTPAAAATDSSDKPTWTVPASWQTAPLTQFLLAKFAIPGMGDAKAEVNISALAGDGGGLLANVNRWRGQLGLSHFEQVDLTAAASTFDASGTQASVVDFTGTNAKTGKAARLIGVVLPTGGQTWFYKLMGDNEVVAQQKDAFVRFIQSAKYPDAH